MSNSQRPAPTSKPLSEQDVRAAIAASGYPLEVRLLNVFEEHGLGPTIGFRVPQIEGGTREVDLIAMLHEQVFVEGGPRITLTMRLVVEAKSVPPNAGFVGFTWTRPTDHALQVERMHFGGAPSNRIFSALNRDEHHVLGPGGLSECFKPLNDHGPFCVQWADVKRKGRNANDEHMYAGHDDAFWNDIDGVVRSGECLMREQTLYSLKTFEKVLTQGDEHIHLVFDIPVLALATPHLWLFDAKTSVLSQCPSLLLHRMFDLGQGASSRLVDVVSEAAVPTYIGACRQVMTELATRSRIHARALIDVAKKQVDQLKNAQLQQLP